MDKQPGQWAISRKMDNTEISTAVGRNMREEIEKWKQYFLRFQTGG